MLHHVRDRAHHLAQGPSSYEALATACINVGVTGDSGSRLSQAIAETTVHGELIISKTNACLRAARREQVNDHSGHAARVLILPLKKRSTARQRGEREYAMNTQLPAWRSSSFLRRSNVYSEAAGRVLRLADYNGGLKASW